MPNFKHLVLYFQANRPTRGELALLVLMGLGAHRMLADATMSWAGVYAPTASSDWLPFDLLTLAVLVALTPVPVFGEKSERATASLFAEAMPAAVASVPKQTIERKRAA